MIPGQGRATQLTKIFAKDNFLLDYQRIELNQKLVEASLIGKVYVDYLESVSLLEKAICDRSIWVSPLPEAFLTANQTDIAKFFSEQYDCGITAEVRIRRSKNHVTRGRANVYAVVEYAHENSVPRSLKLASKGLACFGGVKTRIYKAGTKTAIIFPKQGRKK